MQTPSPQPTPTAGSSISVVWNLVAADVQLHWLVVMSPKLTDVRLPFRASTPSASPGNPRWPGNIIPGPPREAAILKQLFLCQIGKSL